MFTAMQASELHASLRTADCQHGKRPMVRPGPLPANSATIPLLSSHIYSVNFLCKPEHDSAKLNSQVAESVHRIADTNCRIRRCTGILDAIHSNFQAIGYINSLF
jgi:hypothetical protein